VNSSDRFVIKNEFTIQDLTPDQRPDPESLL
jgi:hypothetical protein